MQVCQLTRRLECDALSRQIGMGLFSGLWDLSWPWECLDTIRKDAGWTTSIGHGDTQREAQKLISGPCLGVKARFLSFNRT